MKDLNTPVWQLTLGELKEFIESIIIDQPTKPEVVEDLYLNSNEAIEYLKISKSTLFRWIKNEYIKYEKKGGILRFKKSEIDKVLGPV